MKTSRKRDMREKRGCQMRFKARRKGVFLNQEHVEGAGLAKSQRASLGHVHTGGLGESGGTRQLGCLNG